MRRPEQIRELSLLFLILVAILVFGSLIDGYYTSRTFNRIASSVAIITVVAVGQTLVVLTRNIDLSVGSIVGWPISSAPRSPLIRNFRRPCRAHRSGARRRHGRDQRRHRRLGRVPSIIVTLGTLAIYRGLLIDYSGARTVTTDSLPAWIVELPRLTLFTVGGLEIRAMVALALVIVCAAHFATGYLNFGRRFYAIGSTPTRRSCGLPARRIVFAAFLVSGALSGLAGFMTLARFGTITVENATDWSCTPPWSAGSTSSAARAR